MHVPVLLKEAVIGLGVKEKGLYIDATAGEGGHLKKILEKGGRVLGIDLDEMQIAKLKKKLKKGSLSLVVGNFADIERIAKEHAFFPVDGILLDLGLSYGQLKTAKRGLSYRQEKEPLDMRLSLKFKSTAAELINKLSREELYEILVKNSEEINSRAITDAIVRTRRVKPIITVGELTEIIKRVLARKDEAVYARVWQALRIEVNSEFDNLRKGLTGSLNLINERGRIAVITFHSLEDRIVKHFIKEKRLTEISKVKGDQRLEFARSAILRVFAK